MEPSPETEGPLPNGEESRRFPRLVTRCRVRIRDRFGTWEAETEDVGPRGCRIVTARPQTVGALVALTLECEGVPGLLEVAGQIVWARAERPSRAGISFAGRPGGLAPSAWFDAVVAAQAGPRPPVLVPDPVAEEQAAPGPPAFVPDIIIGPDIVIVVEPPVKAPVPLVDRLRHRAEELLGGGELAAAEVLYRRVLALAPGDAAVEAALRELAAR